MGALPVYGNILRGSTHSGDDHPIRPNLHKVREKLLTRPDLRGFFIMCMWKMTPIEIEPETLKVRHVREGSLTPSRGSEEAAGLDLYCAEDISLYSGLVVKIPTGIALEIPPSHYGFLTGRSSTALKNILVFPTICDADYRGEIFITARFDGEGVYKLQKGDRIAQIVITPFAKLEPKEVGELSETKRGESGYGSSGR